jgi:superfamily II DNA or RNA helicase
MDYKPGSLVRVRERDWIVLPSQDKDLLVLKPLGGSEEEITGIYLPVRSQYDTVVSTKFPLPTISDISDFETARLLFDACRLSFRNSAGPFRSLARLSFRPRSYQMVPLIMALKQDTVRMLIADDVGVGKTIEAGLIVRELIDRGEIKRFAVVCLPHLCDQWQEELVSKFGIEAEVIRSSTAARLDRRIRGDQSVFKFFPYQVISIDYIKSEQRKQIFLNECPDLIIVDEAHTCARPTGASTAQQQRYHLIHDIAAKRGQNLILLTATPHNGKQEEFQSLLGLLHKSFESVDLAVAPPERRKQVAMHFIQRKRAEIVRWMGEETKFPKRDSSEDPYQLSPKYKILFGNVLNFAHGLIETPQEGKRAQRLQYWTALALLRGVMSSPKAGCEMLRKRAAKESLADVDDIVTEEEGSNPIFDKDTGVDSDIAPTQIVDSTPIPNNETRKLHALADELEELSTLGHDWKANCALELLKKWIKQGLNPIVFCRYIATANYVGDILKPELERMFPGICVEVITSELPDDLRKEKIKTMGEHQGRRVLIATDCLSEGVNLQDHFNALIHYDLPWNPNRLDQREGRIDRFGQKSTEVKASLLYGKDNPIDGVVLDVLLRKAREIHRNTGYTVSFPEDSQTIMDAVLTAVLVKPNIALRAINQTELDFGEMPEVTEKKKAVGEVYDRAVEREKATRSIFAQHAIKADEIEKDLKETDEAIGDVQAVEAFFLASMRYFGAQCTPHKEGYRLYTTNLPGSLTHALGVKNSEILISFQSPTPEGFRYLGRNHPFIEQLCQILMADSLNAAKSHKPARTAVIRTQAVQMKTTLIQFRVRNVIEEQLKNNQIVAEEMLLWGYIGNPVDKKYLDYPAAKRLLLTAQGAANISKQEQEHWFTGELEITKTLQREFNLLAIERAHHLVEAHERFRAVVGGTKYRAVEPVLPMDIMGIYVLLPEVKK